MMAAPAIGVAADKVFGSHNVNNWGLSQDDYIAGQANLDKALQLQQAALAEDGYTGGGGQTGGFPIIISAVVVLGGFLSLFLLVMMMVAT